MTALPSHRSHDPAHPAHPAGPVRAEGINGAVAVQGGWLTLRKGLVSRGFGVRGAQRLAIRDLTAVHLQPATDQTNGYLQLVVNGNGTSTGAAVAGGEHTIMFRKASAAQFDRVRSRLEAALDGNGSTTPPPASS